MKLSLKNDIILIIISGKNKKNGPIIIIEPLL
jgi:hypothetical protein